MVLIGIFALYVSYRKYLNIKYNEKFNEEYNRLSDIEEAKTNSNVNSELNGEIHYRYHDSTKTFKNVVEKIKYYDFRYDVYLINDSLELSSPQEFIEIINIVNTKKTEMIESIDVKYRENLRDPFIKINAIDCPPGFCVIYKVTKKGIGQIVTEIVGIDGHKEIFEYKYVVY